MNYTQSLENNIKVLEHKLRLAKDELNVYKQNNIIRTNDTSKLEYLADRITREDVFMKKEIPHVKEDIHKVI
jgi:hypothetical protein